MLRTDFENLKDGDAVKLYPNGNNPLHNPKNGPVNATYSGGYFYCEGSNPVDGPDYYMGDVMLYNDCFESV